MRSAKDDDNQYDDNNHDNDNDDEAGGLEGYIVLHKFQPTISSQETRITERNG